MSTCQTMDSTRRPPPLINPFRSFVTNELNIRRQNDFSTTISSPFTRLTSCLERTTEGGKGPYRFFSLGLHGYMGNENIFDVTYGEEREIVGYGYDPDGNQRLIDVSELVPSTYEELRTANEFITDAEISSLQASAQNLANEQQNAQVPAAGTHPVPGIISVNMERFGNSVGIRANVVWQCYNRKQLEFLRHHFLTAGTLLVLEWGHQTTNNILDTEDMLDFSRDDILGELATCFIKGKPYINQNYNCPTGGNYDFIVGRVANFKIEFEPHSNIYKITTIIISSGENLLGVSINNTLTLTSFGSENTTSTISEIFRPNGSFDAWLGTATKEDATSPQQNPQLTAEMITNPNIRNSEFRALHLSSNSHDYQFVSWNGFFDKFLPSLLAHFTNVPNIRRELSQLIQLGINPIETNNANDVKISWIGNHAHLRSTDPETLLVIKSDMVVVPEAYNSIGKFDDYGTDRGLLNRGIWLNAQMIRECFLQSNSFEQAIRTMLIKMNNAMVGYWELMLYFDEENLEQKKYRIIDYKFSEADLTKISSADSPIYRFNVASRGECIEIKMDSMFPPEVVTQLSIVAQIKTNPRLISQIQQYPAFGSSGYYAFAMNWTNLISPLESIIANKQDELFNSGSNIQAIRNITPIINSGRVSSIGDGLIPAPIPSPPMITNPESRIALITNSVLASTAVSGNQWIDNQLQPYLQSGVQIAQHLKQQVLYFIEAANNAGITIRITSGYRTPQKQKELIDRWNKIPPEGYEPVVKDTELMQAAGFAGRPAHSSQHTIGNAIDISILSNHTYEQLAQAINRSHLGWSWIGPKDKVHFNYYGPGAASFVPQFATTRGAVNNQTKAGDASGVVTLESLTSGHEQATVGQQTNQKLHEYEFMFGNPIALLIEPNKSQMIRNITLDGLFRLNNSESPTPNAFVAPFPTTVTIEVVIKGISGMSLMDGFIVDKLPYIYEKYGVFQITQIKDMIDSNGWRTSITGIFRFLTFNDTLQLHANPPFKIDNVNSNQGLI